MIVEPILFEIEVHIPHENYTESKLIRKITLSSKKVVFEAINNNGEIFFLRGADENFSEKDVKEIKTYKSWDNAENSFEEWKIKYIKSSEKISN